MPANTTTSQPDTPHLPIELWFEVFEQMEFPIHLRVIRQEYYTDIKRATQAFIRTGNDYSLIRKLPPYERAKYMQVRSLYRINVTMLRAARKANVIKKWRKSLMNVYDHVYDEPGTALPRYRTRSGSAGRVESSPSEELVLIHGIQEPKYVALNLYSWDAMLGYFDDKPAGMETAKDRFIDFVVGNPVFKHLRRVDIIIQVSRDQRPVAKQHVPRLVQCIKDDWAIWGSASAKVMMKGRSDGFGRGKLRKKRGDGKP